MSTGGRTSSTALQIPCCLCGTLIHPNAANQCATCLAQQCDLRGVLKQASSSSSSSLPEIKQCRECRRFQRKPKLWQDMEHESPQMMSLCLQTLQPAMSSMRLVDAIWVWTEPHSMRLKLRLTVRQVVLETTVEQRIMVEFKIVWEQCPDCNRTFTNRTWHAVVQVRQKRDTPTSNLDAEGPKTGLAALEMALAKHADMRKHVIQMDTKRHGFDFYFLQLHEAQHFGQFLAKLAPMRIKANSTQLVSTNAQDNTANLQHALVCDLVPFQRHDLVLVHKNANLALQGRLVLVDRLTSVVHLLDAAPTMIRNNSNNNNNNKNVVAMTELTPDAYFKTEKMFQLLLSSQRLVPFVVLDVELHHDQPQFHKSRQGSFASHNADDQASVMTTTSTGDNLVEPRPNAAAAAAASVAAAAVAAAAAAGPPKYALADVVVARQVDFGVNDQTFDCVTHLGHLLQAGDIVLGYDLSNWVTSGGTEININSSLPSTYQIPAVVLVRKEKVNKLSSNSTNSYDDGETLPPQRGEERVKGVSKKKMRHKRRNEERKAKELEEAAARMGFLPLQQAQQLLREEEEEEYDDDDGLEADLQAAEQELANAATDSTQ